MTIIKSSGLRNSALTPGSDDGVGNRGMSDRDRGRSQEIYDQFRAAYGIPAKRGCAVIPWVMASAAVLSSCAANQQTASTAISPQEEQDRAVCLQHAHRDSGFNEKAIISCMSAKGYKKNNLYPSVTIADAGSPSLTDTLNDKWKKIVQAVSPDNAARQPDSENAGQGSRTENTTSLAAGLEGPH